MRCEHFEVCPKNDIVILQRAKRIAEESMVERPSLADLSLEYHAGFTCVTCIQKFGGAA